MGVEYGGAMTGSSRAIERTPAVAALVAVLVGVVASVQFSIPSSQSLGITTLYLWPITLGALWFGVRAAVGIVAVVMLVQIGWYASVPHGLSAGGGAMAVVLRGGTYLFVASVVGEFAGRLRRAALEDPLTKLPNRRAFFEELQRRSHVHDRLGVVIADVDGLKQINDRDGHEAGDAAIIQAGQSLRTYLGEGAFVCRFGGDEFLALTSPGMAERVAGETNSIPGLRLGASVHSTTSDRLVDEAIALADQSLYRAKSRRYGVSSAA